ncbi:M81 family metallopeptidase [Herbaspirillum lusitanum]|uniref:Microcystinase C n=1 Tax=Herbaspirillum lusitanum TaxID=213312 RepID=A0ABW9A960_9BURK
MRILIAGFQHETNTFAPSKASYSSFEKGEGFPMMQRGAQLLALREVNIPAGGFILAAEEAGHELLPVIWAGASPSAHVTADAYARIAGEIVDAARSSKPDAIYLDLHGAMVAESTDDGEGTLLELLRAVVGPTIPIVISLDLHANVTQKMLTLADALVAYRTYPHVDLAETGARAFVLLQQLVAQPGAIKTVHRRLPFLIPINGMCTLLEPAQSMYAALESMESSMESQAPDEVVSLSFCPGFPAADFPECGPVIWGHGKNIEAVARAVAQLYDKMMQDEALWEVPFLTPDAAVKEAIRISLTADKPVVIADTQDNPGAGGDSNTMGMLRALLANQVENAAIGLISDPQAAALAHAAGIGARLQLNLAGTSGVEGDSPFAGEFEVIALSDGRVRYDGPMMTGMLAELGPTACLRIGGVDIAVSTSKAQMFDRNLYRVAGIHPESKKILVNKSSVHFRADFQPVAAAVLVAKAPGPMVADPAELPWRHLQEGIRTSPGGPAFVRPV